MRKILVIEDEVNIRHNIQEILELDQFQVLLAVDGLQGLSMAQTYLPDLIICDVMMPEMDGLHVLQALQKNHKTDAIPFVFLTAKADHQSVREGMNLGADDYLVKPFDAAELLNTVHSRLKKRQMLQEHMETDMNNLRQAISRSLSHEINTPLNGIIGAVQLMLMDQEAPVPLDLEEQASMLEVIRDSADRLWGLAKKFQTYAELEIICTDKQRMKIIQSNPHLESVSNSFTSQDLQLLPEDRRGDINLNLEPSRIRMDDHHWRRLVLELLENACKFSPKGSGINVVGHAQGDYYRLSVMDHGLGMTSDQVQKVAAYVQFNRLSHEHQGTGLGLAIVQHIVQIYQGHWDIQSDLNVGTIVTIDLPCVREPKSPSNTP